MYLIGIESGEVFSKPIINKNLLVYFIYFYGLCQLEGFIPWTWNRTELVWVKKKKEPKSTRKANPIQS